MASKSVSILGWNLVLWSTSASLGQVVSSSLPETIVRSEKYLFYLHGQVVTDLGDHAINPGAPEWGPYEYRTILDSLRRRGFNVISEIRQKNMDDSVYVHKVAHQIASLVNAGVSAGQIVVVGASSGWAIALRVSSYLRNNSLNVVMMGGCWPTTYKEYTNIELYGRILSIIEETDPHGTCSTLFDGRRHPERYKEIVLHTGLSHGFFYKGRPEWIDPIIDWLKQQ